MSDLSDRIIKMVEAAGHAKDVKQTLTDMIDEQVISQHSLDAFMAIVDTREPEKSDLMMALMKDIVRQVENKLTKYEEGFLNERSNGETE